MLSCLSDKPFFIYTIFFCIITFAISYCVFVLGVRMVERYVCDESLVVLSPILVFKTGHMALEITKY